MVASRCVRTCVIAARSTALYRGVRRLPLRTTVATSRLFRGTTAAGVVHAMEPREFEGKTDAKQVSDAEWQKLLTQEEFRILRKKGTEYPGTGEYNKFYPKEGTFHCAGCHAPLYTAKQKFDSGCGWPAFYDNVPGAVTEVPDADGMRIEIICSNCGGHLGHTFKGEGFPTPTNERHCVNSVSIKFNAK